MILKRYILTSIVLLFAGVTTAWAQNVAKVGEVEYPTLSAAVDAAQSGETIELLADITTETGNKSLKEGVTLDGKEKTISGDIAIYISKYGGTVQNVNFKNIHNASTTKSAIYSEKLEGTATITGCTFDNCDWDAIQITPVAGASVVITNNTFSDDNEDGITQKRYIHVQSSENVDFSATITENVMLGNNGGPMDVYYPTDKTKLNLTNNYIAVVDDNLCILIADDNGFAGELAFPAYTTADKDETYSPEAYVQSSQYAAKFYSTFAEAATAAENAEEPGNPKVISLVTNVTDAYTMSEGQTLKVKKNSKSITVKAPEGLVLKPSTADDITTYTLAEADIEYTAANGTVSYKSWSNTVISASGTYKLLRDITASARIVPGAMASNVTLDLNGHTITSTATDEAILLSRAGTASSHKVFNIVDSSTEGGGTIIVNANADHAILVNNVGTSKAPYTDITIGSGVTIDGGCVSMLSDNSTLTVEGTINGGDDFAIATNGGSTQNTNITIKDGAVITSNTVAMYLPGTGTTTIEEGATITGSTGIYVKSGTLNIEGGEITGNGEKTDYQYWNNGCYSTGDALVVDNCGYPGGAPVVNVTGGTFTSANADAIASYSYGDGNEPLAHFVSGGYFSNQISDDLCVEGKSCFPATDKPGYYTVAKSIANSGIIVTVSIATYNGEEQTPTVVVKDGEIELTADTDYEVSYSGNPFKDAKVYVDGVIITGKGNYGGVRNESFTIVPRNINDVTVEGNNQPYSEEGYSVEGIKGLITLKYNTETLQTSDTDPKDYTIAVDDTKTYKDAGTYPEVITLTAVEGSNYTGSRKVNFYIGGTGAKDIATCSITATTVYNGSSQVPSATTVVIKDASTNEILTTDDYELTYTDLSGTDNNYKNAKTYENAVTISGNGNYYGTKTFNYIIAPKNIAECTITNFTTFNNAVIIPRDFVTVTDGGTTLSSTDDYTLTVSDGYVYKDPGTYANAITITGKGNYTGTVTKDFIINNADGAKNLADGKLLVTSKAIYTGATQVPDFSTITVLYDGTELTSSNISISYAPNNVVGSTETGYKDAQTYSGAITITALTTQTAYYGTVTADYVIAPRNMKDDMISSNEAQPMAWTGGVITPKINTVDEDNNIILKLGETYKLISNTDYTYTVAPSPIKEVGIYTIIFEGRGNFTGTSQPLEVHVQKNISDATVTVNVNRLILPNGTTWGTPDWTTLPLEIKDGNTTLAVGTDYDVKVYSTETSADNNEETTDVVETISSDGIYYARITGKDELYTGNRTEKFYVLKEYYTYEDEKTSIAAGLHITEITSTEVIAKLGNAVDNDSPVIDNDNTTNLAISEQPTVNCGGETISLTLTGIEAGAFNGCTNLQGLTIDLATITEVANGAFIGCTNLRYIDLSSATEFEPSSLQRNIAASPFNGVPKQALVFLNGTTFEGENYVYNPGNGNNYYCEVFKIYDDFSGAQTGFDGDDYKWAFENPHEFTAYSVENTRQLIAERHYTICLPYDLEIPSNVKAYTLEATSDKLFGFKEVTGTLAAFTPYVLIPTKSGQLLGATTNTVIPVFPATAETDATKLNGTITAGSYSYTMYGTMRYMDGDDAVGLYIMQYNDGNPTWKKITEGGTNGIGACILPMRAYIMANAPSGSREFFRVCFTNIDGTTLTFDELTFDDDSIYDLQGRKAGNLESGRLYIINGKKVLVK